MRALTLPINICRTDCPSAILTVIMPVIRETDFNLFLIASHVHFSLTAELDTIQLDFFSALPWSPYQAMCYFIMLPTEL